MLKNGLLFVALAFLSSDSAPFSEPELREAFVATYEGPVQILGRFLVDHRDCDRTLRTQAGLWADSALKSPLSARSRLGLGVGLQDKAKDLWERRCLEAALKLYEKAAGAYQQTIQLTAGDSSNTQRTFRLQASMNLATIFIQIREFDEARKVLLATLNESDVFLPAIVRLAEVELRTGHPGDALAVTERLRSKRFEDIGGLSVGQFWAFRAEAHCQLGDADQANWEIEKARRSDPNVRNAQCRVTKGD